MVKKFMCIKHAGDCYALQESVRCVALRITPQLLLVEIFTSQTLFSSRKYPYPPHGRSVEIPRGWRVSKAKTFKVKCAWGLTGISRGVGGFKRQKPSVGGVWIFSGGTNSAYDSASNTLHFYR